MRRLVRIDFVRFCLVGALGFIINYALLSLFYKVLGWPLFVAQIIAAELALFHNFVWHNHWTYRTHRVRKTFGALIVQFHATSWVAIVGSALLISVLVHVVGLDDLYALVITSAIAMAWNFTWTKFVIWRHDASHHKEEA